MFLSLKMDDVYRSGHACIGTPSRIYVQQMTTKPPKRGSAAASFLQGFERASFFPDASERLRSAVKPWAGEGFITAFGNKFQSGGSQRGGVTRSVTIDGLADFLAETSPAIYPKGCGPAFVCGASVDGSSLDEACASIDWIFGDIDGSGSPEALLKLLESLGVGFVAHSRTETSSHLYLALSRQISGAWLADKSLYMQAMGFTLGVLSALGGLACDRDLSPSKWGFDCTFAQRLLPLSYSYTRREEYSAVPAVDSFAGPHGIDFETLLAEFGFAPAEKRSAHTGGRVPHDPRPLLRALRDANLVVDGGEGERKTIVICPWHEAHSSDSDGTSTTVVFNETGVFKCLHGSCADRTRTEVENFLRAKGTEFTKILGVGELPIIEISNRRHEVVSKCIEALGTHQNVYQQHAALRRIVRIAHDEVEAQRTEGNPVCSDIPNAVLSTMLSEVAKFVRYDDKTGELRSTSVPDSIVLAIAGEGHYPAIRVLRGIVETPHIRPDGSLVDEPGHDAVTGLSYTPNAIFPKIPKTPTQADAREALSSLEEAWCDFPFATEADRVVPVAALLTLLARGAIDGNIPAFLFDANVRAAGKTRVVDQFALIATGRPFAKSTFPNTEEELEKKLAACALRNARIVGFDNISQGTPFGGTPLNKVLTCGGSVSFRILGKSEEPEIDWNAMVCATGNNVEIVGDLGRRVLLCRLRSPYERPELRKQVEFRHPDLQEWTERERPRLVVSGLTLLRAWWCAGCPDSVGSIGSFESWTRIVPNALIYAGAPDVTACLASKHDEHEDSDPDTAALRCLIEAWPQLATTDAHLGISAGDICNKLANSMIGVLSPLNDSLKNALRVRPSDPIDAVRLVRFLKRIHERVVDGKKLSRISLRRNDIRWVLR